MRESIRLPPITPAAERLVAELDLEGTRRSSSVGTRAVGRR
jgi:hypothetical protein